MHLTEEMIASLRVALKKIAFLEYLTDNEFDALIQALDSRPFRAGEVIIKQGTHGDTFYILGSGALAVYREQWFTKRKKVAALAANDIFGEMALLDNVKRTATVVGEEDGHLYFLPRDAFRKILLANPGIAQLIRRTAEYRKANNLYLDLK